jgi:hypothetical protein
MLGGIQYVTHWSYISHVVKAMVRTYVTHKRVNVERYDKLYSDLESFLYNSQITLVEVCPLLNFHISYDTYSITLSDNLSVRRINDEERTFFAEKLAFFEVSLSDIMNIKYVIEYKFQVSKGFDIGAEIQDQEYPSDLSRIFTAVITALRLYKEGAVGAHMLLQIVALEIPIRIAKILLGLHVLGLETDPGIYYTLTEAEVKEFVTFWKKYSNQILNLLDSSMTKKDPHKNVKTALNRFNSAYHKRNPEDKIVDWIISFESLFSTKDHPIDSISYRLALRGSRFSKVPSERKEFYHLLKSVYGVRSKIVHGDIWEQPKTDVRTLISKFIVRYLDELISGHDHITILNSVDFD